MKRLRSLFLPLFIIFIMITFITVPQALSRSPDKLPYGPGLILDIESLVAFQAIEKQFIFVINPDVNLINIDYTVKTQESYESVKNSRITKLIIRPTLLL